MITVINYSDARFEKARKFNTKTAYKFGADRVIEYSPKDMPIFFLKNYPEWCVENDPIIGRYCLWRPFIVLDALEKSEYGDVVIYCDAGAYFVNRLSYFIEMMNKEKTNALFFELPFLEKQWTKRDIFVDLDADKPIYTDTNQVMSTIFVLKKTNETVLLMKEFANIAKNNPSLFTDEPNRGAIENYPEFKENRHNQSVLSIIVKKHGYKTYRDPSEYGIKPLLYKYSVPNTIYKPHYHQESNYPQIIVHHRSKKIRFDVYLFSFIRRYFPEKTAVYLFNFGHKIKYLFRKRKQG